MLNFDFFLFFFFLLQPIVLVILIYFSLYAVNNFNEQWFDSSRARFGNTNYFECSSYSKNKFLITYDIFIICLCSLFILYDVDILFFISTVSNIQLFSFFEILNLSVYSILFVLGLYLETKLFNYIWN